MKTQQEEQFIRIDEDGDKLYFKDKAMEILHRLGGPAVEFEDGSKVWYANGKLHRPDGPAVEYPDGSKFWFVDGKCHRLDGPAYEYSDGTRSWYVNGEGLTEEEFIASYTSQHTVKSVS
jgi:hypothetical protein